MDSRVCRLIEMVFLFLGLLSASAVVAADSDELCDIEIESSSCNSGLHNEANEVVVFDGSAIKFNFELSPRYMSLGEEGLGLFFQMSGEQFASVQVTKYSDDGSDEILSNLGSVWRSMRCRDDSVVSMTGYCALFGEGRFKSYEGAHTEHFLILERLTNYAEGLGRVQLLRVSEELGAYVTIRISREVDCDEFEVGRAAEELHFDLSPFNSLITQYLDDGRVDVGDAEDLGFEVL